MSDAIGAGVVDDLIRIYRLKLDDKRLSRYGKEKAEETALLLEELKVRRASQSVPVEGTVS